jgi:hypothetical protein
MRWVIAARSSVEVEVVFMGEECAAYAADLTFELAYDRQRRFTLPCAVTVTVPDVTISWLRRGPSSSFDFGPLLLNDAGAGVVTWTLTNTSLFPANVTLAWDEAEGGHDIFGVEPTTLTIPVRQSASVHVTLASKP